MSANGCAYLHEVLPIEGGARGRMIDMIRTRWAPHLEATYGVRLFGVWAEVGSTAAWPQVRVQWEYDDLDHFARAQAGQYPMEERDVFVADLWNQALDHRLGGTSQLLRPAPWAPDLATVTAGGLVGEVVMHEDYVTLPGRIDDYHAALEREGVPLAADRGLRLLGTYANALRPNEGFTLWGLESWGHWQALMEGQAADTEWRTWTDRQGEWLADLDGFLVAVPPSGALRT